MFSLPHNLFAWTWFVANVSTFFLSLPPMFLTSGATLFHPSPLCHYPFLFDRPWSYKDVGDSGEGGSMTWKIPEASVASHLRERWYHWYIFCINMSYPQKIRHDSAWHSLGQGTAWNLCDLSDPYIPTCFAVFATRVVHKVFRHSCVSITFCILTLITLALICCMFMTELFVIIWFPNMQATLHCMFWRCFWNLNLVSNVSVHFHHWAGNWLLGWSESM